MATDLLGAVSIAAKTVKIDTATAGNNTLHTVTPGKRFVIYHLWLQAEAGVDVIFKSNATNITAPITFAANAEKEWKNSGALVFAGLTAGDNFVMNLSGAFQVNGFFVVAEVNSALPF